MFFLLATGSLSALEGFYAGLGAEMNYNSRESIGGGGNLTLGLEFTPLMDGGIKAGYSRGVGGLNSVEIQGLYRYKLPYNLFIQAELGYVMFHYEGDFYHSILGGVCAGMRFFSTPKLYLEPTIRAGYPYIWGAGLTLGLYFNFQ